MSDTFPNGVSSGDVDADSAVLWSLIRTAGAVTVEWSRDPGFATVDGMATGLVTDPALPVKVVAEGLQAGTTYRYRFTDALGRTEDGGFETARPVGTREGFTFGVTGDWRGELAPYPAIRNVAAADLELFVKLGDTIYADVPSPANGFQPQAMTLAEFRAKHAEVYGDNPGPNYWAELQRSVPILSAIDDHEVTNDFAGGAPAASDPRFGETTGLVNETMLYRDALQAFGEYNAIEERRVVAPGDARADGRPDLYRSVSYGSDAAVLVLDARSFRDAELTAWDGTAADAPRFLGQAFDPARSLLGGTQFARVQADLLAADRAGVTWKFVMVPEPTQNYGPAAAEDRYEGYAAERSALLRFIDENDIENVVFVAADVHGTTVNNLTYQLPGAAGLGPQIALPAFEVTTGSVAYDAPFGPSVVGLAAALGLLPPGQAALYGTLPPAAQEAFLQGVVNAQLDAFGYDRLGLDDNLPQARGLLDATLRQGGWTATNSFGWSRFDIAPGSGELAVTTWGIAPYGPASGGGPTDAAVLARQPEVRSLFTVEPSRAIEFELLRDSGHIELPRSYGRTDLPHGNSRDAAGDRMTDIAYVNAAVPGEQRGASLTDTTGADLARFRAAGGDVVIAGAGFASGEAVVGQGGNPLATLDWTAPDAATLRLEARQGGVAGVDVADFTGASLRLEGWDRAVVDLTLRPVAQSLELVGARHAGVAMGGGDDAVLVLAAPGDAKARREADAWFEVTAGTGDDLVRLGGDTATFRGARTVLVGNEGADTVIGAASRDRIDGGPGADVLTGGGGRDVFVLRAGEVEGDVITDFRSAVGGVGAGTDRIELVGFGGDVVPVNAGGDVWTIGGETFRLLGISRLVAEDQAFA